MLVACAKCRSPFEGRSNRQYCSTSCKSSVNNERQLVKKAEQIQDNKILNRNRSIMIKLHEVFGSDPIDKKYITKMGLKGNKNTGSFEGGFVFYEYTLTQSTEHKASYFITKK